MERERLTADETAAKSNLQRSALDRTLSSAEQENAELQRQVRTLEQQLASLEQQHLQRLNNINVNGKTSRVCAVVSPHVTQVLDWGKLVC